MKSPWSTHKVWFNGSSKEAKPSWPRRTKKMKKMNGRPVQSRWVCLLLCQWINRWLLQRRRLLVSYDSTYMSWNVLHGRYRWFTGCDRSDSGLRRRRQLLNPARPRHQRANNGCLLRCVSTSPRDNGQWVHTRTKPNTFRAKRGRTCPIQLMAHRKWRRNLSRKHATIQTRKVSFSALRVSRINKPAARPPPLLSFRKITGWITPSRLESIESPEFSESQKQKLSLRKSRGFLNHWIIRCLVVED